ncbi:G-type lectin S-receptor-like serine/threonine-protein kinase RKS1 [Rutidosis leptorrhynchoides]|uniref:G-type lectin S-receptor-like serine/threonine-protein kinase RKS1 n=1 Tax=Rutidosis leptorrhynchoides TaxID=125765 RepID=UPI003A99A6C4
MKKPVHKEKTILVLLFIYLYLKSTTSTDTITLTRPVKDGDVLVSIGESFALGFFSPRNSSNRYVGIWYNKVSEQTVVWVANRNRPISNSTGTLSVDKTGNLVIHENDNSFVVWSTNVSSVSNDSFSAQLLDSGNLVLFNHNNNQNFIWQSFDYPSNTFLPGLKLGLNKKTGLNRMITSWKSSTDPGVGDYSYKMEFVGSTQLFLFKGTTRIWRTGSWTGHGWSGVPEMTQSYIFNASYVNNNDENYATYLLYNTSIESRFVINESGIVERSTWHEGNNKWIAFWSAPKDQCDGYNHCGSFGICDLYKSGTTFECDCFPGYEPQAPQDWYLRDGTRGCKIKDGTEMCKAGDGFVELARVKVPDTSTARVNMSLGLKACEEMCRMNCTCLGYALADISKGGSGCIAWYDNMSDSRTFSDGGQSLYVRVDAAELAKYSSKKPKRSSKFLLVGLPLIIAGLLFCILGCCYIKKKRANRRARDLGVRFFKNIKSSEGSSYVEKDMGDNVDLHVFDLSKIVAATDNFSLSNKVGEGGFGSVYKGTLQNGQEVAVKRLSQSSGQGMQEFENEVTLIAKLQHRNLVRLLGYCFHRDEKMLIYEYLPNKGLDSFIFDQEKGSLLEWNKRFQIIRGIIRGLLYLHQDSRLRIIHRDLKASNVLLDADLNPKISDFGMAKIFGGEQDQAKTRRVVGTYGYMSPEYAMEGLFSVKSDVFSFGILVLEIISGRKNSSYYKENSVNLIGHVWELWKQEKALSVVDTTLLGSSSFDAGEIMLCIHVGILCVQESANDRPTMTEVAYMLSNRETKLPTPNQPAFIFRQSNYGTDSTSASASGGVGSVYDGSITILHAR